MIHQVCSPSEGWERLWSVLICKHRVPQVNLRELFLMPTLRGWLSKFLIKTCTFFDRCNGHNLVQLLRNLIGRFLGILTGDSPIELGLIEFLKKLRDEKPLCEV